MAVEGGAPEAPFGRLEGADAAAAAPGTPGVGGAGEGPSAPVFGAHASGLGLDPASPAEASALAPGLTVASTVPAREGLVERLAVAGSMLLAGLLVGVMTTFLHRARLGVGGAPIWLGIVVGLAIIAVIAVGLRLYLRERGGAIAFASGVVIAITVLATWSAGHSVIVVGDLIGTIWISAAPILVWAIALWPEVRRRPQAAQTGAEPQTAVSSASAAPSTAAPSAAGGAAHYAGASNIAPEEPLP